MQEEAPGSKEEQLECNTIKQLLSAAHWRYLVVGQQLDLVQD